MSNYLAFTTSLNSSLGTLTTRLKRGAAFTAGKLKALPPFVLLPAVAGASWAVTSLAMAPFAGELYATEIAASGRDGTSIVPRTGQEPQAANTSADDEEMSLRRRVAALTAPAPTSPSALDAVHVKTIAIVRENLIQARPSAPTVAPPRKLAARIAPVTSAGERQTHPLRSLPAGTTAGRTSPATKMSERYRTAEANRSNPTASARTQPRFAGRSVANQAPRPTTAFRAVPSTYGRASAGGYGFNRGAGSFGGGFRNFGGGFHGGHR